MSNFNVDLEYVLGNYVYEYLESEIVGDVDMFKYILGKIILLYLIWKYKWEKWNIKTS